VSLAAGFRRVIGDLALSFARYLVDIVGIRRVIAGAQQVEVR